MRGAVLYGPRDVKFEERESPGSGLVGGKLGTISARAGHEVLFSYARCQQKLQRLARDGPGKARPGTLAGAKLKVQGRSHTDSCGLFEGGEGQSWAEKSLKNGRILVELQKLRKPQATKGTCFSRHLPSALLEWGFRRSLVRIQ